VAVVVELTTEELLALEVLEAVEAVEQAVLIIVELPELLTRAAAVAAVQFKPTHLIGLAVRVVLV
jgi:hypothetical protein